MWCDFYAPVFNAYAKHLPTLAASYNSVIQFMISTLAAAGVSINLPVINKEKMTLLANERQLRKRLFTEPDSFEYRLMRTHCMVLSSFVFFGIMYMYSGIELVINTMCFLMPLLFRVNESMLSSYWSSLSLLLFTEVKCSLNSELYFVSKLVFMSMMLKSQRFSVIINTASGRMLSMFKEDGAPSAVAPSVGAPSAVASAVAPSAVAVSAGVLSAGVPSAGVPSAVAVSATPSPVASMDISKEKHNKKSIRLKSRHAARTAEE